MQPSSSEGTAYDEFASIYYDELVKFKKTSKEVRVFSIQMRPVMKARKVATKRSKETKEV